MTRRVRIGSITIGGGDPIAVQSMWKAPLDGQYERIARQIESLRGLGLDILRFAVPDMDSAEHLGKLSGKTDLALVADIHYDFRLALRCLDFPIAKLRINPGNIGNAERVSMIAVKAKEKKVPIRIGVNSGSLPQDLRNRTTIEDRAGALVEAALREVAIFEASDFFDLVVSMKASSVQETILANTLFSQKSDIPLHLGVTEAGPLIPGLVKSAVALHSLISKGIGDTLRVSLSSGIEEEIIAGREITALCHRELSPKPSTISCPRCGRNGFDVHAFLKRWERTLQAMNKPITVAVMGCVVNGPEEARHADIGITGAGDYVLLFRKGEIVRKVKQEDADNAFREELALL